MLPIAAFGVLSFAVVAALGPELARAVAAKEGPLEHASHALLAGALLAWSIAAARARGDARRRERRRALLLALYVLVVLGEELDWGAVYGIEALASEVRALGGRANLHNAWSGASYVLFALPALVLVGGEGWRRPRARDRGPSRGDAIGLGVLAVSAVGGSLGWPQWEPELDEVVETLLYLSLLWMAVRPVRRGGPTPR